MLHFLLHFAVKEGIILYSFEKENFKGVTEKFSVFES